MRLRDRVAIVVGAGQSPGEGIGNGRATALTFAREGAKVLCVDHNLASAQETVDLIVAKGGTATAFKADVTKNADIKAMVADARKEGFRIIPACSYVADRLAKNPDWADAFAVERP